MKLKINKIYPILLCVISTSAYAQKAERSHIKDGNKFYESEKYTESEIEYRKAIEVNPKSEIGYYNLGNAMYKQGKFPEAVQEYEKIIPTVEDKAMLARLWHNVGDIQLQNKDYGKAVEAFKSSLRNNPLDDETRYNLAFAQKKLQDQQNEQNKDDQQNQDQQDQKDEQNKDEQNQEQQQQDQNQDNQKNKTQEQQQQNEQMSQDNAQQILNAFLQDEKDTQEKVKKAQQQKQQRRRTDKDW
ncbi:MAG: tetratricopeptide repeat protein [Tannerellaceae bacterium]